MGWTMSRSISERTVSTANSGMPCARAVTAARAGWASRAPARPQLVHRRRIQRVQGRRDPVPAGAEPRTGLAHLGAGEHQHIHRQAPHPVGEIVREIQQPRIGVLGVLHQQYHRVHRGRPLEK